MDTEQSSEVLVAPEAVMEKEVVSNAETPEESTEPEKPPAAGEEPEQTAVNGHDAEPENLKGAEEEVAPPEDSVPTESAPEPDESTEKITDPVAALETEPGNIQPVPEKDPEPMPVETAPEPGPEKSAELVPESLPEPAALQQPVETQPLAEEAATMSTGAEEAAMEDMAGNDVAVEPTKEKGEEKPEETVLVSLEKPKEEAPAETVLVSSEKPKEEAPAETVLVSSEKPKEEAPAEGKKEVAPEKPGESDTAKGAEAAPEVVEPEKNDAEPQKEEETVPAPGSLSFAFLEREQTKDALKISRTLVVLRGLPGSGKSFLARAIAEAYKDHCSVICADDHGVKPESPESSVEGYKALDEAVVACCGAGAAASSLLMVVDDSNHTQDRLARLGEIAEQHHLVPVFLEPQTEWSRDVAQLIKKTKRGLEEAKVEAMRGQLEEMSLPFFFGWFLLSSIQDKVRCTSMDFLKTLDTLEAFKKHSADFTGKAEKEVDLEQYFKAKGTLHCTTKFTNYGKAEGAKEYAQNPAVKEFYGSATELSLSALFVTPRTVGARVSLSEEQLLLWPADADKAVESAAASLPLGSRAHVTLGCAEGVEPVQTGLDLLEILALQQGGQQGELVEEMELGSLTYYGEGRWLLALREPTCAPALFSSFYGPKEADATKKEPEKKKKQKCTIL